MFRVVSSGPYSGPVDGNGPPELVRSKVCGHEVERWELGAAGLPRGQVYTYAECCRICGTETRVQVGEGKGGELFVTYCDRLALRPFDYDPDDFTEHEFWLRWVESGRAAAVTEALNRGYQLAKPH